ncbi:hypothetical protein HDU98_011993 [Podochytrium sp. JEL0797]|nr:hypothetical protein HDU98_011993 [Podochytrium sp. JEL0797]
MPNMDPTMARAAQKIFAAIQRDAQLTQLCTGLSKTLATKGVIDPSNPMKQPSKSDLMMIAMDREVVGVIAQIAKRLGEVGVLNDPEVVEGMKKSGGAGGVMGALLGGGSGPAPVVEEAEVVEEKEGAKKAGVFGKFFKK